MVGRYLEKIPNRKYKVRRMIGKIKEKVRRLTGKVDRYQKAVTFAEAGQQEYAQETLQIVEPVKQEPRRLVVIGRESVFSQEIIDYAIEMAERMSYEIIALNAAPLSFRDDFIISI